MARRLGDKRMDTQTDTLSSWLPPLPQHTQAPCSLSLASALRVLPLRAARAGVSWEQVSG